MITPDIMSEWRSKFLTHKSNAARRGIEFLMTFQEWLEAWGEEIVLRGPGKDGLAMCRFLDRGPYGVGNVYIATNSQNGHDVTLHNLYNKRRVGPTASHACGSSAMASMKMATPPDEKLEEKREFARQRKDENGVRIPDNPPGFKKQKLKLAKAQAASKPKSFAKRNIPHRALTK